MQVSRALKQPFVICHQIDRVYNLVGRPGTNKALCQYGTVTSVYKLIKEWTRGGLEEWLQGWTSKDKNE